MRTLQKALNNANFQHNKGLITIDGRFGPSTFRTLIDFQKWAGLSPDGVAGPLTIKYLGIAAELPNDVKPSIVQESSVAEPVLPPKLDVTKIIKSYETKAD